MSGLFLHRRELNSVDSQAAPNVARERAVDIIILDWNRPTDTVRAVHSALAQRGVHRRVWVVDQGSSPDNRAQLAAYCNTQRDVHVHWLDANVGVPAGRNIATRLGQAPYVVSLDNDAVFADEHCVARAVARLEREPSLGALAFRIVDAQTLSDEAYWDYPAKQRTADTPAFPVTRFLGGGHALRRAAFEAAGRYDERLFFGGEERDLAWRMIGLGYRLRLDRDLVVVHRSIADSKIHWNDRRYYFLVRNTLYIDHKFGAGALGFARGAAGFALRGARSGLLRASASGIRDGLLMSLRFRVCETDKQRYRLSPQTRHYIASTDGKLGEPIAAKLRRLLEPLPRV
jgi:GT2 family glycosyltransferase